MHIRTLVLIAAAASASPLIANASPEKDALNKCAQAFASSLASPGAAAPTYKVAFYSSDFSGSMIGFYNREYTFELHARDPKTGQKVARASCSTDIHGAVVSLTAIRMPAAQPALAARF